MQSQQSNKNGFIPRFKAAFLLPRYWGIWFALSIMAAFAYLPSKVRDPMIGSLARLAGKWISGARKRARANLRYCFPALSEERREQIIDDMFVSAAQSSIMMVELSLRSPERILDRICWHGREILDQAKAAQQNVILMVPHGWSVDIPAILLSAQGQPMAAMFHNQKNQLVDWLWNKARKRFGGRLHARNDGIKPFISSIRQGYWGYYLPDQDHGPDQSEFVDFFATYKATLPALGRLMKMCKAHIIPLFPVYDATEGKLHIYVRPPMDDLAQADAKTIARRMNEEIEQLITPNLEHYTWILKLLKTRKPGDSDPYEK